MLDERLSEIFCDGGGIITVIGRMMRSTQFGGDVGRCWISRMKGVLGFIRRQERRRPHNDGWLAGLGNPGTVVKVLMSCIHYMYM